ncbi:hypothetical protein AX17_001725 [Amanita inopinata Kibby_2008]|nr:hypothetical protein AX17_001725 [Amanita inopinata Kibby_2008]
MYNCGTKFAVKHPGVCPIDVDDRELIIDNGPKSEQPKPRLESLTIGENDAIDTFIQLAQETRLTESIKHLGIQSTNRCDFSRQYEPEEFEQALPTHTSIVSLDLVLDESCDEPYTVSLCEHLPPNVEQLRFWGPRPSSVFKATDEGRGLEDWMACVGDGAWLPRLRTFMLRLDWDGERIKEFEFDEYDQLVICSDLLGEGQRDAMKVLTALREARGGTVDGCTWYIAAQNPCCIDEMRSDIDKSRNGARVYTSSSSPNGSQPGSGFGAALLCPATVFANGGFPLFTPLSLTPPTGLSLFTTGTAFSFSFTFSFPFPFPFSFLLFALSSSSSNTFIHSTFFILSILFSILFILI